MSAHLFFVVSLQRALARYQRALKRNEKWCAVCGRFKPMQQCTCLEEEK